jgi:uncharacterized protein
MFQRLLNLESLLEKKSFFLFGPRATGKSFLIKHQLGDKALVIDLLQSELYLRLSTNPELLESMVTDNPHRYVVIDEVQKIPILLNEVHRLIENKKIRFLLTGSSARKLRHGHVNLLAGRAWEANLFPLTSQEIPDFDLTRYLHFGGLPPIYASKFPHEELLAYVNTYLKEEIQVEALVRKIPAFSRFLQMSALTSGTMLNFASISNDAGIPATTVREYYQILEDTFIGFMVPAWQKTQKRKAVSTGKFYFFDLGVKNTLAQISQIDPRSDLYGQAFEHFIAMELRAYISYNRLHQTLSYWQTQQGHEVDFIVGDDIAIEVKTTSKVSRKHLKGLKRLAEENICNKYYLISHDKINRQEGEIKIIYWQDFLKDLWSGKIKLKT